MELNKSELNGVLQTGMTLPKKHGKGGNKQHSTKPVEKPLIDIAISGRPGKKKAQDEERLVDIVNTIAINSPFGRAVLEDAAANGYTLIMENQEGSCGFCSKEDKIIALNPRMSEGLLTATLAHEARHAQQFAKGAEDRFGIYNVKSEVMYTRAMEADAETAAAATCHEIRVNSGNSEPWDHFAEDSVNIAEDFKKAAPTPNAPLNDKMLQAAFLGWYKDGYIMDAYEDGYIGDTMTDAMMGPKKDMPAYDQDITSKEIVSMFCSNAEGKGYWANKPDVLEDADLLSISSETRKVADKYFQVRQMRTGKAADASLATLKVRAPSDYYADKAESYDDSMDRKSKSIIAAVAQKRAAGR